MRIYSTVTKWVFIITLPLFLYIFLAPDLALGLCFGAKYMEARLALQLLALGFFTDVLFGLNAMTNVVLGRTKINLLCLFIAFVVNLILDLILIPEYGITGASIASCTSLVLRNVLFTVFIYRFSKIHPFARNYLKILSLSVVVTAAILVLPMKQYLTHNLFFLIFILSVSPLTVIITGSITEADASIIKSIERKITKHTFFSDKLLRFIGIP